MNDDVAGIDDNPVAAFLTLDAGFHAFLREFLAQLFSHADDLAGRPSRHDDHVVGDGGFARKVNGYDVFALVLIKQLHDEVMQLVRRFRCIGLFRFGCYVPLP